LKKYIHEVLRVLWPRLGVGGLTSAGAIAVGLAYRKGMPGFGESWDLVKIVLVLVFMVVMLRHQIRVGLVLILSAALLGFLFSVDPGQIVRVLTFDVLGGDAGLHRLGLKAINLALIIYLVNVLGQALHVVGGLDRLIGALERMLRDVRHVAAVIPAVLGLLPMPGGAMLSAPMVGELGDRAKMNSEEKTLVNYWFRHVWEYSWPLFPGLILISRLIPGYDLGGLLVRHFPLSLAAIGVGYFFVHRRLPAYREGEQAGGVGTRDLLICVRTLWPVATIGLSVGIVQGRVPASIKAMVFPVSLLVVDSALIAAERVSLRSVWDVLKKSFTWEMVLLVLGIYVLRAMFETAHAAERGPQILANYGIPTIVTVFAVPFLTGLLTGYTVAVVSTTFPALVEMLQAGGPNYVMVAYAAGFFGVLVSPVHLCLILTRDYFDAHLGTVYRRVIPMVITMTAVTLCYWALPEVWGIISHG